MWHMVLQAECLRNRVEPAGPECMCVRPAATRWRQRGRRAAARSQACSRPCDCPSLARPCTSRAGISRGSQEALGLRAALAGPPLSAAGLHRSAVAMLPTPTMGVRASRTPRTIGLAARGSRTPCWRSPGALGAAVCHAAIGEGCRRAPVRCPRSGAWTPLRAAPSPAARSSSVQQHRRQRCRCRAGLGRVHRPAAAARPRSGACPRVGPTCTCPRCSLLAQVDQGAQPEGAHVPGRCGSRRGACGPGARAPACSPVLRCGRRRRLLERLPPTS